MTVMRVKSARLEELMIKTLAEGQPLRAKEFYRKLCSKLRKGESVSEPTFYRYLVDLERRGVFERTPKGWRLNERGLLRLQRINCLNELLRQQKLIASEYADVFGNFDNYYLETKFSEILQDAAEEVIRRFYLEATIAYLMTRRDMEEAANIFEFFDNFLGELGLAIWLGCELVEGLVEGNGNLWQLISDLTEDREGLDLLSTYLLSGLERIFAEDEAARMFLKVLHHVGFLGELILWLMNQDRARAERILSGISGPPREDEADWSRLKSFIGWLMGLKAVGVVIIAPEFFASIAKRIAMSDFESWLNALREGRLDHRVWIFDRGKQLLETLIRHPEWLQDHDGLDPNREEALGSQIDIQEAWTLGDLVRYHPRGRDISFYKEILEVIEKREEARRTKAA